MLARVPDLEGVESRRYQLLHEALQTARRVDPDRPQRVRKRGDSASCVDQGDRTLCRQAGLHHEGRAAQTQKAPEGLVGAGAHARLDQGPGHVGPSERALACDLLEPLARKLDPQPAQSLENLEPAPCAGAAQLGYALAQGLVLRIDSEPQDVHLSATLSLDHGDLDARDDSHPELAAALRGLGHPRYLVVVGQGE